MGALGRYLEGALVLDDLAGRRGVNSVVGISTGLLIGVGVYTSKGVWRGSKKYGLQRPPIPVADPTCRGLAVIAFCDSL